MARFSVITPINCWNEYRKKSIKRAADSLDSQTFKDFEWIVVNDGSTVEFEVPKWAKVINKEHEERVIALNTGFKNATGEIYCLLDSDDAYEKNYLEKVDGYYRKWPKYELFNFGCSYVHSDGGTNQRNAFRPKKKKVGHEVFGGGNIVNGTYVFTRKVYEDLGAFPEDTLYDVDTTEINYPQFKGQEKPYIRDLYMGTPYDFSAAAQMEFPEIRKRFMVDVESEPNKVIKELGNPWGQDYYLFYKYTRKYHSKPIDDFLYRVYWKQGVE